MEFALTLQVKNKPLFEAVQKLGSQAALARYLDVSQSQIGKWLALKETPSLEWNNGFWRRKIGDKLLALTGYTLDEIFPPEIRNDKQFLEREKKFTKFVECEPEKLIGLIPQPLQLPDETFDRKELGEIIDKALLTLTPRQADVIKRRFGLNGPEEELEEIAVDYGVTRERIRQIEAHALRLLAHPSRSRSLRPFS